MGREWIHENPPTWGPHKARIVGGAEDGIFDVPKLSPGDVVPGEWWRVEDDGDIVGFGWMDVVWGDGEILLAVAPDARGRGVGSFILDRLEAEARSRGLAYVYNSVRVTHPHREQVGRWLREHGFSTAEHGSRLERKVG